MRYVILTLLLLATSLTKANAQLNVELLHQLVAHSKDEYDRQITARNRQAITTANEEVNKEETAKLKTRYRELHSRFQVLGTALQGLSMGLESAPIVTEIINQQKRIIGIVSAHPEFLLLAINAEKDMAEKAVQLARYLTGLFISIGDLNQMKASDRRILYGHVLQELRAIAGASRGLAVTMYYSTFYATANSLTEIGFGFNESGLMFASVRGHTAHHSSLPVGGLQELFGVSIHSYAVPFLFHLPALEFSNRFFSPETLFGNEGKLLTEKILTASTTEKRVHILTEYFKSQLKRQRLADPLASNAVQRIRQHNGLLNIADLADDFHLSKKQFERRFKAGVGFNPKLYARIVRFEAILNNRRAYANLTEATYANGYYDQAHLIRDFKAFTGYSPNKFFAL